MNEGVKRGIITSIAVFLQNVPQGDNALFHSAGIILDRSVKQGLHVEPPFDPFCAIPLGKEETLAKRIRFVPVAGCENFRYSAGHFKATVWGIHNKRNRWEPFDTFAFDISESELAELAVSMPNPPVDGQPFPLPWIDKPVAAAEEGLRLLQSQLRKA